MINILFYELQKLFFGEKRQELFELERIRHFRRSGSISPHPPLLIQLQTHSSCNGRCIFCPYTELNSKLDQGKIEWPLFEKIADDILRWEGLGKVLFMLQNEPFLDKDFFEYIRYIKHKKPEMKLTTVTNGTLLQTEMVERISESGLDEVTISLDAFSKETYKTLHPGFSFEKVLEGIQRLLKQKPDNLVVRLSFVSTKMNYHELPDFIKFAKGIGAQWRAIFFFNRADSLKGYRRMRLPAYKWHSLKPKLTYKYFYRTCPFPFARMSVLFNGDAIICCHDWQRNIVVGNAKTHSLQEIWSGKKFDELRKTILHKQYHKISSCARCNIAQLSI